MIASSSGLTIVGLPQRRIQTTVRIEAERSGSPGRREPTRQTANASCAGSGATASSTASPRIADFVCVLRYVVPCEIIVQGSNDLIRERFECIYMLDCRDRCLNLVIVGSKF